MVEWQVVHAHGMDGKAERMGIRRVQWVASPRPGGSASARPVGRFECGDTSFELEAGRDWEERQPVSEARWTTQVANTVRLVYEDVWRRTWWRSDGRLARQRLPSSDNVVRNYWLHYCEETRRKPECVKCVVHVAPTGQSVRVTVRL